MTHLKAGVHARELTDACEAREGIQMTISTNLRRGDVAAVVLAGAFLCLGAFASSAAAGTYHVWECGAQYGGPASNDVGNNNAGNSTGNAGYTSRNDCANVDVPNGFSYSFGHQAFTGAPTGYYRAYDILAPPGTRFLSGSVEGNLFGVLGHEPLISLGNGTSLSTVERVPARGELVRRLHLRLRHRRQLQRQLFVCGRYYRH